MISFFQKNELEELKKKNYKSESIAGNFAAKEAVVKSVGTGLRGFNVKDIEILRDNLNKPVVVASGNFKIFLDENNIKDIKVSISHSKSYATAIAIAIK